MAADVEEAAAEAARERDVSLSRDPSRRRASGIVHTPSWIARFVVAETARALAEVGGAPDLAGATLIDPAIGTGVFPAAALALGYAPRTIVGVDSDAAAIESARIVLMERARARGVGVELRVGDALDRGMGGEGPVVVVGNPPWAARSGSRGVAESDALVATLRPPGERRSGVLSDAYVRFLAWACALAERVPGPYAIGLVTNGSFLDGPVHALLRERIASTFDVVRVVDLGGGSLVARAPGTRDENVFGVRPPAAITIAARGASPLPSSLSFVQVRGTTAEKRVALAAGVRFESVRDPRRSFRPAAPRSVKYEKWRSVAELFPFHREGVQTNRDALAVDADRDALVARLHAFATGAHDELAPSRSHFAPAAARRALRAAIDDGALERDIVRLAFRPLDDRWVCLHPAVCHRPRPDLRAAMAHGGVALITTRKDRGDVPWAHFGATRHLVDNCWLSTRSSCRARAFPAFKPDGSPNAAAREWEDALGIALPPETILLWTLGILSGKQYREQHREELRSDYPRIPPPPNLSALKDVVAVAKRLADEFTSRSRSMEGQRGREEGVVQSIGHHSVRLVAPLID